MAETALQVVAERAASPVRQSFEPTNLQEAIEFSKLIADSELAPKDFRGKPANVLVALQLAKELNVPPMQGLQGIAVVNGRATVWGDLMWALVTNHPAFEDAIEEVADTYAKVTLKRRGRAPVTVIFSQKDAETAGLWKKQGPWTQYPKRQMQWRARTFAARDLFPDALKGMVSAEEAQDYEGTTIDALPSGSQSTATPATTKPAEEPTIGMTGGNDFFKIYANNGWSSEQSVEFLATIGIVKPKSSKDIPVKEWTSVPSGEWGRGGEIPGGAAWKWATSPSPIKAEVTRKFDLLDFSADERREFFKTNAGEKKAEMYVNVDKALSAELDKRAEAEQ